jgi:SAM-dependent methyltransferase
VALIGPYDDAILYDLEYADHTEDIAYYVDRARTSSTAIGIAPRVLELGCGTGRLTLPIARAGVTIVGVDRARSMVEELRHKLEREKPEVRARVAVIEDSYPTPAVTGTFQAVLWPFNALHHCPNAAAVEAVLVAARQWLAPGASVYLDAYLPDRELYDRDPEGRYEPRQYRDPASGQPVDSWEQGWWDEAGQIHHVVYVYRWPDGRERRTHLELRMFPLGELHEIVGRAGLKVSREGQDFRFTELGPRSLKWVAALQVKT